MSTALLLPSQRSSTLLSPVSPVSPSPMPPVDLRAAAFRRAYAHRLMTGSVYQPHPRETYSVLVVRTLHFTERPCHYRDWSPGLAPHADLEAFYSEGRLSWETFAQQYLARLRAFPYKLAEARIHIANTLARYPSVTLLGMEHASDETAVCCHRRLLRSWLLGNTTI